MDLDTKSELRRYEERAKTALDKGGDGISPSGFEHLPIYLQDPYACYYDTMRKQLGEQPNATVVELGAGDGRHSIVPASLAKNYIATDISPHSLELLKRRLDIENIKVKTEVADMSKLPFDDRSIDLVVCAGSLSYANPDLVDQEIMRVLKEKGSLICVDTLNHNPVYRFNRYLHYLRGNRSKSTIKRMPNLRRIKKQRAEFKESSISYFGALTFTMPLLSKIVGEGLASTLSKKIDRISPLHSMAFKYVFWGSILRP